MAEGPMSRHVSHLDVSAIADLIEIHGNYSVAVNNVRDYAERFIPVRRLSPEALHYLHVRRVVPDIVYIDAFKEADDLAVAHDLFPEAALCGDDWNWSDGSGTFPMREHVVAFCDAHGLELVTDRATWVVQS